MRYWFLCPGLAYVTAPEMEAFMHLLPRVEVVRLYQPPDDSDIAHEFTAWLAARRETLRTAAGAGRPRDSQADVAAPDAAGGEESPDNETGRATPPAPAPAAASGRRRRRKPLAGGGGDKENADVEMDALMVERPRPAQTEQRWRAVLAARHESYDRNLEKDNPERPWYNKPHFQGDVQAECQLWARVVLPIPFPTLRSTPRRTGERTVFVASFGPKGLAFDEGTGHPLFGRTRPACAWSLGLVLSLAGIVFVNAGWI